MPLAATIAHQRSGRPIHRDLEVDLAAPLLFEPLEPRVCPSSPGGPEILVNATTAGAQAATGPAAVASDAAGNLVIAWESFNQDAPLTWGVYGRRLDASGALLGGELGVSAPSLLDDQRRPSVARAPGGGFVAVWHGAGILGLLPSVYAQMFDAAGAPQGPVIPVAAGTALQAKTNASVAMAPGGGFIVVWESANQDALLSLGVYARVYNADGTPRAGEFLVNQTTAGDQSRPVAAADSSGRFIVAWAGQGVGDSSGIFCRAFDASGNPLTGERLVNAASTAGTQELPSVAATPGDGFIIAWSGGGAGDPAGVFAQRLDSQLDPIGGAIAVNSQTAGIQTVPSVAVDPDGDFVIAWSGQGAQDPDGIYAREFAADGGARGGEMLINLTTAGVQSAVSAVAKGDNAYAVVWSGAGTGDADGVFARLLFDSAPVVTVTATTLQYTEGDGAVAIDPALSVTDADDPWLTGATVAITSNFGPGEDALAFADQLGITGVWNAALGVLTLSGVASVAAYQAALRAVTYANTSEQPSTLARAITFTVGDGVTTGAGSRTVAVSSVNDAPVVTNTGGPLLYTEGDGAVWIDPGLVVSDVDSPVFFGATVAIAANYAPGQDALAFVNQLGITGSWNAASGILTLSGVASPAAYQAALRAVTYSNSSEQPSTLARTITFTVDDGAASGAGSRPLWVAALNDPPLVATSAGPLIYSEDSGPVVLDPGLTIADVDSASLTGATVRIAGHYQPGEDHLLFTAQSGITGSWDPLTGVMTLSGVASIAAYQSALRSVAYLNTSQSPAGLSRTIHFTVNDGIDPSIPAARTVAVVAINDAPALTATGGGATYFENSAGTPVDPRIAILDPDSPMLVAALVTISGGFEPVQDLLSFVDQAGITGVWNPLSGVLSLSGPASLAAYAAALRSVMYLNTSDDPGTAARTITFQVSDGSALSAPVGRGVVVIGLNDAPLVATSRGLWTFAENSGPLPVDPGLILHDPDSPVMVGATVRFIQNYVPGQDVLLFVEQAGITGVWDAHGGVLTLSGFATLAGYQAALRSVAYDNPSDAPSAAARSLSITLDDGQGQGTSLLALVLEPINDAPVVLTSSGSAAYTQSDPGVAIDPALVLSDPDSSSLVGATVSITGQYRPGQDVLLFTDQRGISGHWNESTGVLTLSGAASVADYQVALRSVHYYNTSGEPSLESRTVTFAATDGSDTGVAARLIVLVGVPDPPEDPPVDPPTEPPVEPPADPPIGPPADPPLDPPPDPPVDPPGDPPDVPPEVPPVDPPLPPPPVPPAPPPVDPPVVPPVVPPADPGPTPQAPPGPPTEGTAPAAAAAAPAPQSPNAPVEQPASPTGTLQVIELLSGPLTGSYGILGPAGVARRVTIAIVQAGGVFAAGYAAWLVLSYSLTRHSLFLLPNFDPVDLHCLLRAGRRQLAAPR